MLVSKFVVKNSLLLSLFIVYKNIHYSNLNENDQLIQLLFFSKSIFAKSIFFLWNNMNFLKFKYDFARRIAIDVVEIYTIQLYFDWLFINFIECKLFIVLILNCIAFMRFFDRVFLLKSSCDFLTRIFWYIFIEIIVRSVFAVRYWKRNDRKHCSRIIFWRFEYKIWKIHFTWMFRQIAQTFSFILTFSICRYRYKQSKTWNDWRLSLKTLTWSNNWNHLCKFVAKTRCIEIVCSWNFVLKLFFCNFQFFQTRTCFLNWTIRDNKTTQSIMIAIFNCMMYNFFLDLFLIVFRSNYRKIDFSFKANFADVKRLFIENIWLITIHEWC